MMGSLGCNSIVSRGRSVITLFQTEENTKSKLVSQSLSKLHVEQIFFEMLFNIMPKITAEMAVRTYREK